MLARSGELLYALDSVFDDEGFDGSPQGAAALGMCSLAEPLSARNRRPQPAPLRSPKGAQIRTEEWLPLLKMCLQIEC